MTASNRRRGLRYEQDLARWLRTHGHPTERTSRGTHQDTGDLANTLGLHIEAKNHQRLDLATWIDQAVTDATGSGRTPIVIAKRRGTSDRGRDYAILQLTDLLQLLSSNNDDDNHRPSH